MSALPLLLMLLWNTGAVPHRPAESASRPAVHRRAAAPPRAQAAAGWTVPDWSRDPFKPVLPPHPEGPAPRPPGLAGLPVGRLRVVAVAIGGPTGPVGMIADASGHTYFVRPGDHIFDAVVVRLSDNGIWFQRTHPASGSSGLVFRKVS